jgi:ATP-dependent exoDNAse (exonuclease V) alpha subunit
MRLNDRAVGVTNGDRGVITGVDVPAGSLTVRIANRETVLPAEYLQRRTRSGDPVLQHGYAMTAYVAQGLTCRTALVLAHDDADQEWAYTAMSRAPTATSSTSSASPQATGSSTLRAHQSLIRSCGSRRR